MDMQARLHFRLRAEEEEEEEERSGPPPSQSYLFAQQPRGCFLVHVVDRPTNYTA